METTLLPEERQANVSKLIARWKVHKKQSEEETKARVKTPEYQAILANLRERNAAKGIIIPENNEFDFVGGSQNSYLFQTVNFIVYEIKFTPTPYLFGKDNPFADETEREAKTCPHESLCLSPGMLNVKLIDYRRNELTTLDLNSVRINRRA